MNTTTLTRPLKSLDDTIAFANRFVKALEPGDVVYLKGDLGAGKTTLTRSLLSAFGVTDSVTSPTYSLIEPYKIAPQQNDFPALIDHSGQFLAELTLLHCDLYRLSEPEELEYLGMRELFTDSSIAFIEWPKRGAGFLPEPTIHITLQHFLANLDAGDNARELTLTAPTKRYPIIRSLLD